LSGKIAACFDLRSGSGYESLLPLPTAAFWRTVEQGGRLASDIPPAFKPDLYNDRVPISLLRKASVGLLATPPGVRLIDMDGADASTNGAVQIVYQRDDGWIYRVNDALPRAFIVPAVVAAPDAPSALRLFVDETFDARKAAVVIDDQAASETGLALQASLQALVGSAAIETDRLNELAIKTTASQKALLVVNDSWDSGWIAEVDGERTSVLRVNYAFRGVAVPQGNHTVVLRYRPRALITGLVFSALSLVGLTALLLVIGFRLLRPAAVTHST
jgi:hypothetical protein